MHDLDLILTLTGGLAAALALGYVTHRLGLSPIVGYLLAGIAVGPYTPGFVANRGLAEQLAEIGVILLMFGVGLQFHLKELLAVKRVAIPGAVGQSVIATLLAAIVFVAFGKTFSSGVVFGLAISVASTVVLVRVLADNRALHTVSGHIAVGWLVVEDLFTVVVLVLLPAVFGGATEAAAPGAFAAALGVTALKIAVLVGVVFFAGGRAIPWLLDRMAATRSRELFVLTVLVVALGIAVGSAKIFGVSMALGAFLAGMIVGRSDFASRAASEALPMRDAFAVLFFVSVGMLFDPNQLVETPGLVLATLGVILVGKPAAALLIVLLLRFPLGVGLSVAVALAQIGEFSFILAAVAEDLGIFSRTATNVLVAAAIVSITLNPLLYRLVAPATAWASKRPRLARWLRARMGEAAAPGDAASPGPPERAAAAHRAIVVGYGPVGRTVARLLRENGVEPTVIELNLETVRRIRAEEEGIAAVYGDATQADTLKSAGVELASSLVLSASGVTNADEVIRRAREANPDIRVLARTAYVREVESLRRAGAEAVFSGEGEVALALTESILRTLGATPEQVERERDRVHAEVLSASER